MVRSTKKRHFIDIMVASDRGSMFIKAIDGLGEFKDKHFIAGMLKDAIK